MACMLIVHSCWYILVMIGRVCVVLFQYFYVCCINALYISSVSLINRKYCKAHSRICAIDKYLLLLGININLAILNE